MKLIKRKQSDRKRREWKRKRIHSRRKKSFYDIGLEVLGKQCNKTRSDLIDEMIKRYSISEAKATSGLEKLISNNVIEVTHVETNVERYYMADSTPF